MRTRFSLIEVDSLGDEGLESPEMVVFKRLIENLYNIMTNTWYIVWRVIARKLRDFFEKQRNTKFSTTKD